MRNRAKSNKALCGARAVSARGIFALALACFASLPHSAAADLSSDPLATPKRDATSVLAMVGLCKATDGLDRDAAIAVAASYGFRAVESILEEHAAYRALREASSAYRGQPILWTHTPQNITFRHEEAAWREFFIGGDGTLAILTGYDHLSPTRPANHKCDFFGVGWIDEPEARAAALPILGDELFLHTRVSQPPQDFSHIVEASGHAPRPRMGIAIRSVLGTPNDVPATFQIWHLIPRGDVGASAVTEAPEESAEASVESAIDHCTRGHLTFEEVEQSFLGDDDRWAMLSPPFRRHFGEIGETALWPLVRERAGGDGLMGSIGFDALTDATAFLETVISGEESELYRIFLDRDAQGRRPSQRPAETLVIARFYGGIWTGTGTPRSGPILQCLILSPSFVPHPDAYPYGVYFAGPLEEFTNLSGDVEEYFVSSRVWFESSDAPATLHGVELPPYTHVKTTARYADAETRIIFSDRYIEMAR